jgi:syntaxin 18
MGGGGALGMDELGRQMAVKAKSDYNAKKGKGREDGAGEGNQVGTVPSIYRPAPPPSSGFGEDDEDDDDNPLGSHLTAEQVQQFEAEESALLKSTQSDLEALKTAESSLLEIASLQSQLAMHLTQQSELTDKLWEDAVTVTGKVGEGNQQLKKAKERGRESRVWLLIFLFGSSFTLLFLDYYSS